MKNPVKDKSTRQKKPYKDLTWYSTGPTSMKIIYCMIEHDGDLYIGGRDNSDNAQVIKYDSSTNTWSDAGEPDGSTVNSLGSDGTDLYAGCGTADSYVRKYSAPSTWADIGEPGNQNVAQSICYHSSDLYAYYRDTGGSSDGIAVYDSGTTWDDAGAAGSIDVGKLVSHDGDMYCAGSNDDTVYKYSAPTTWNGVGSTGVVADNNTIYSDGTDLYVGGGGPSDGDAELFKYSAPSTWNSQTTLNTKQIRAITHSGSNVYMACYNPGIADIWMWDGSKAKRIGTTTENVARCCTHDSKVWLGCSSSKNNSGAVFRYGTA